MQENKKKLLITGCGRSGTLYTAEVFRSLGLDIQHERDYRPDGNGITDPMVQLEKMVTLPGSWLLTIPIRRLALRQSVQNLTWFYIKSDIP